MHKKLRLSSKQVSTELSGETMILHIDKGIYFQLNETGTLVWNTLSQGDKSLEELSALLVDNFEIDQQTASQDTEELIKELNKEGLIEYLD